MVQVKVLLYATLRSFGPGGKGDLLLEMPAGSTVIDIVNKLGIPLEELKLTMVNGVLKDVDYVLVSGDRIGLFPPVGGG